MAKIVFFCIPAHGHTNPTLPVVRELVARGHEVRYYSYEIMREKIEAAGAVFVSCNEYDAETRLTPTEAARIGKDLSLSTRVLADTTLALDAAVCRAMTADPPDCIVADSMAVWGKAAAMKLGIPFVSSTTTFAFNRHSARIMKQSPAQLFGMLLAMPRIQKHVRRLQESGYPIRSVLDLLQNDDNTHTIVYTSPGFQPCADTFSDRYAFVGPVIRDAVGTVTKTAAKLVYISLGTVNNDMLPFYKDCITAFRGTELQVILSVGESVPVSALGDLPENVSVFSHTDQIAVLQRADVFLSHCGMNSASESLYHGVPMVTFPQTTEQGGVAARILQLGAGVPLSGRTPGAILSSVRRVLENPEYTENARAVGDGFRQCSGAAGAADKILQVCGIKE